MTVGPGGDPRTTGPHTVMTDTDTTASTTARQVRETVETVTRRQGFRPVDHSALAPASRYADHNGLLGVADPAEGSGDDERGADAQEGGEEGDRTVLAPELTTALARAVAGEDKTPEQPSRWRATGPCWRAAGVRPDGRREFHRTAALLVGTDGPEADAELLSLTGAVLGACGLEATDATIRVSHRGLLAAVFDAFSGEIDTAAALSATATHDPGTEAYHDALVEAGMNYGQADTLSEFLRLGVEELDALAELTGSDAVAAAVQDLRATLEAVDADAARRVAVSLSAVLDGPYAAGLTFEVDGPAGDLPAVRGGRCDDLVGASGGDAAPAVGIEVDRPTLARLCSRTE